MWVGARLSVADNGDPEMVEWIVRGIGELFRYRRGLARVVSVAREIWVSVAGDGRD